MRVIVTGSRQFLNQQRLYDTLDIAYAGYAYDGCSAAMEGEPFVVVHGAAPGADTLAAQWCWDRREEVGIVQEPHPADWRRGSYAGNQRNFEMVQLGADLVLAFLQPGAANSGTRNCLELARRFLEHKGTEIREIWNE